MYNMFNSISEIIIGKAPCNYIENPMKNKELPESHTDYTYNAMIDVVEKVSEIIIQPYDYIKCKIQNNDTNLTDEEMHDSDKEKEEISDNYVVIILNPVNNKENTDDLKYENIYKNNEEESNSSIDSVIKSANSMYTYMISNYNDTVT